MMHTGARTHTYLHIPANARTHIHAYTHTQVRARTNKPTQIHTLSKQILFEVLVICE